MKDLSECRILALKDDYKLSVALDGQSALKNAEKNPPDLVLLNIVESPRTVARSRPGSCRPTRSS